MRKFRPRNRNSNLFGAVYQGISALEEKLAATAVAEKQATLIVFTDRADLSHTVGIEQMKEKLKSTPVQVYIIGVGEQINRQELTMLARAGTYLSNDPRAFKKGFEEINQKLVSLADGRYVLSYCSTKRKGSHKLEIEVETPAGEAKISHKFSAVGFKNGCTPTTKPVFEEIEALKADAVTKQKELDAKEKEKEEAEAAAAVAAIKAPEKEGGKAGSKDNAKAGAKEAAKSGSASASGGPKAAANQTSKPAPPAAAKPAPKEAAAQVDLPPAEPEQPKASASPAKQAVDKE